MSNHFSRFNPHSRLPWLASVAASAVLLGSSNLLAPTPAFSSAQEVSSSEDVELFALEIPLSYSSPTALVSSEGKLLREPDLSNVRVLGDFIRAHSLTADSRAGLLDRTGQKWVVEPVFKSIRDFSADGLARVQDENDRWGFINRTGQTVIDARYPEALPFSQGLAAVRTRRGWSFISTDGEVRIRGPFVAARSFSENGLAAVADAAGQWGFINRSGDFVLSPRFAMASSFGTGGLAPISLDGESYGLVTEAGEWRVEPRFDSIGAFNNDGWAAFSGPDGQGFFDPEGRQAFVEKTVFGNRTGCDRFYSIYEPHSFRDASGKIVAEVDWATPFIDECIAVAHQDGRFGLLRQDGTLLPFAHELDEPMTDPCCSPEEPLSFLGTKGLLPVFAHDGVIDYYDAEGKVRFEIRWRNDDKGTSRAELVNQAGQVIWKDRAKQPKFTQPGRYSDFTAKAVVSDQSALTGLAPTVAEMIKQRPKKMVLANWRDDPFEFDEYDWDDSPELRGSFRTLVFAEGESGASVANVLKLRSLATVAPLFERLKAELGELLGSPEVLGAEGFSEDGGDIIWDDVWKAAETGKLVCLGEDFEQLTWVKDGKRVVLCGSFHDDHLYFQRVIWLAVITD